MRPQTWKEYVLRKVVLLACDDLTGYTVDDDLLIAPFADAGWHAEFISWSATGIEWSQYEAVIIRATWDYHYRLPEFLSALQRIEAQVPMYNSRRVVEWNAHKGYLLELEGQGVPIVPTIVQRLFEPASLEQLFKTLDTDELILKPMVSAGAYKTYRFTSTQLPALLPELEQELPGHELMVQPFVQALLEEGEYSLFYFNGDYSHAIIKRPVAGDFRVQEEWGGMIDPCQPLPGQREVGEMVLALLPEPCLYARVDMVRGNTGEWQVMEVELIEPSLYLRMDEGAPERFVRAALQRLA